MVTSLTIVYQNQPPYVFFNAESTVRDVVPAIQERKRSTAPYRSSNSDHMYHTFFWEAASSGTILRLHGAGPL